MARSDQFKSILWDDNGTSIVIDEIVFKKEVLERKAPIRIFETGSMNSLVRQLNLYVFSKVQQNFQRSACLADFLEEEKEVSVSSKLQIYHNPNFKRECHQLLVRIKRRVGIKNASLVSSLPQDINKKLFKGGGNNDITTYLPMKVVSKLQPGSNPRFPVPVTSDTSATSLSRPTHQTSSVYESHPNYN
ncbi:heat shock transcription factor, Y-linked-like isoform X2 [Vicugna pacos]|uniref:Heat shock transcription factor, Y-linked-like isoform X2 n=1 Tax=Vicugna pacos TaxID=30538 RepID=A0ABM5CYF9_VICPA